MKQRSRARILWTHRAEADLEAIGDFIAQDNPVAAARWVSRLIAVAEKAAATPSAGRRVRELGIDNIREVLLRTYRIVYRVRGGAVEILAVFEGHRLFPRKLAAWVDE